MTPGHIVHLIFAQRLTVHPAETRPPDSAQQHFIPFNLLRSNAKVEMFVEMKGVMDHIHLQGCKRGSGEDAAFFAPC